MSAVLEHRPLAKLDALQAHADEFTGMRRDIHRHPELGFQEFRTSELVAERLTQWGYSVTRGLGGTGVVGQLQRGTGAKRLGLRADMDALPIVEATGLAHASCHTGVMHACGHDGHTAMLLAAAQHLAEHGDFSGTLNLIFQPAEEGLGGAVKMMEDGLFARFPCDAIFGMHNMPGYPAGHLALRDGPAMASSDYVGITIHGNGGHGAMPHRAADPVVAASSLVMALQDLGEIVSAITSGVGSGLTKRGGEMKDRLKQAVSGLDDAVGSAAQSASYTLREAAEQGRAFKENELKSSLEQLRDLEAQLVDTLKQTASQSGGKLKEELESLSEHLKNSGTRTGEQVRDALQQLASGVKASSEVGRAGLSETASTATERLSQVASGILDALSDSLKRQSERLRS